MPLTPTAPKRPRFGTPRQVADYALTTEAKLANDRYLGVGIPYVKFGRKVLYSWEAVDAYFDDNTVSTTGDAA